MPGKRYLCHLNDILSFLASLFHKGYSYISLNLYCSTISSIHDKIDGVEVGSHPLVSHLLKGVINKKPPLPKYSETWPVEKVFGYLKSLGLNLSLSLQQLTQKLAVLLALTTASRSSDLALIDVNFRHFVPGGIHYTLGSLTKQARPKHSRTSLEVESFTNPLLCPVMCMHQYLAVTQSFQTRVERSLHPAQLFLAVKKPHAQ